MSPRLLMSLLVFGVACRSTPDDGKGSSVGDGDDGLSTDSDGDGFSGEDDCDEEDASANAGATEVCNGVDDDCDGEIDEGLRSTWYSDSDGDGFGDPDSAVEACEPPEGTVDNGEDCDDSDAAVHPGAEEVCDELDNDCDLEVDEGVTSDFYRDADSDGFGDPESPLSACEAPDGYVSADLAEDCTQADTGVSTSP